MRESGCVFSGSMSNETLYSFGSNAGFLAELYQLYREDPSLVEPEWADFFKQSGFNGSNGGHAANGANGTNGSSGAHGVAEALRQTAEAISAEAQLSAAHALADRAIDAFRRWGHLGARLSPIQAGGMAPQPIAEIASTTYTVGKSDAQMALRERIFAGRSVASVPQLLEALGDVYCSSVGYEYEHIVSPEEQAWLRERIESGVNPRSAFTREARQEILKALIKTGLLESELHRKYVGSKWFSIDGNDSLMPALQFLLDGCATSGVREVIFGMAHRGRINVLVNTLGMSLERLFSEFEDRSVATAVGAGDVKYHLGWQSEYANGGASVRLELLSNPSHLEFVNPVVEGVARAKQDSLYRRERRAVLPLVMHGDAAFAGQGTVFECLNYAGLEGYSTGGTFHIVINNQIGFTTTPDEGRSTRYCTDLAKGLDIPIFHVNTEDPEAA